MLEKLKSKFEKIVKQASKAKVSIGWFPDAKYPTEDGGMPVAVVARWMEDGVPSRKIPARPSMRPTIEKNKAKWAKIGKQDLKRGLSAAQVLNQMGLVAAGDLEKTIIGINSPELSPITVILRANRERDEKISGATVGKAAKYKDSAAVALDPEFYDTSNVTDKPLQDTGLMIASIKHKVTGV